MLSGKWWGRILLVLALVFYSIVFYAVNFRFLADKIFYQPNHKIFATQATNKIEGDQLVIGVVINGEAKAYPIELIGYHHQVQDTIGGAPVMITYCTVCHTGRVFHPIVNGKKETFRLVGMDHFNAMFEDNATKSWWRQVTGEAITGPLKGTVLAEIPSQQMTVAAWLKENPSSLILQPDPDFTRHYAGLQEYGKGTAKGGLEGTDTSSWKPKSRVVGIEYNKVSKAYDWNTLVQKRMIQDSLAQLPLLLTIEKDSASFHAFDRRLGGKILQFTYADNKITDSNTNSTWNENGRCTNGVLQDYQLKRIQASQEFWLSWKTFHPNTTEYN